MGDFHIRRIILPSGKAVEIVYFDAEGVGDDEVARRTLAEGLHAPEADGIYNLEQCRCCSSRLVYPVDWREGPHGRWELELRCPNCEWGVRDLYPQDAVEQFDEILNQATDDVIEALQQMARDNMAEEIERFVAALAEDHILPMDF